MNGVTFSLLGVLPKSAEVVLQEELRASLQATLLKLGPHLQERGRVQQQEKLGTLKEEMMVFLKEQLHSVLPAPQREAEREEKDGMEHDGGKKHVGRKEHEEGKKHDVEELRRSLEHQLRSLF